MSQRTKNKTYAPIHVVVQERIDPMESIQPSFMLCERGWGLSKMKTALKKQGELSNNSNQSIEINQKNKS